MKHSYKIYLVIVTGLSIMAGLSLDTMRNQPSLAKMPSNAKSAAAEIPSSALGSIQESLSKREYHVSYDSTKHVYQSPNRQHNLRAYYAPGTLTVCNRKDTIGHNFQFRIINKGIFADGKRIQIEPESSRFVLEANTAEIRYDAVVEQYVNSEAGIRQNFIIGKPAEGSEKLQVQLAVDGATIRNLGNNELELSPQGATGIALTYQDLKCWDADGNMLAAVMTSKGEQISISVDVKGASFPVTIDPIIANGTPANAILVPEVNQAQAWLGGNVSSAGDVNGDGYSDVIVAASKYDNGEVDEGAAWVYYGSASGLSLGNPVMLQGNQQGARFGYFVSTTGDINKDGYSDIMVGALMYDKGETNEGAVFVYHGSAAGISTNATLVLEGNQAEAYFGNAMGLAGDVNGDGYSDVVIGANSYDNGQANEGVAFVYYGSAQGLTANSAVKIEGNQAESMFGFTATGAGDVNGDGYSDIMVGARLFDKGQVDEGAVFIYHGSALGINPGVAAVILESNQASAGFGHAMGTAGDVNGDGYSDIVVSANMYDKGQTNEGAAFVFHGSAQGISPVAALTLEMNQTEAQFGSSAGSAGDVNGDGYADVIVGAKYYDKGQNNEGAAFIFEGTKTGLGVNPVSTLESNKSDAQFGSGSASAGDINGDGYSDVIVGAIAYSNGHDCEGAVFLWTGGALNLGSLANVILTWDQYDMRESQLGFSVSAAGDINADGFDDILVGAKYFDTGQSNEGAVFVYKGSLTGINFQFPTILESNQPDAQLGTSVSSAGDVNGDGYADIIAGAVFYEDGQENEGAAFIYHGSASGIITSPAIILQSNQANSFMGYSVCGGADFNKDGFSDIVVGAMNYDNGQQDEGAIFVYLGGGTGISPIPNQMFEGNKNNQNLGWSVANAGDVNGDGYIDLATSSQTFGVLVYLGVSNGLSQFPSSVLSNQYAGTYFGFMVSGAGDVNGDGYGDLVVGTGGTKQNGQVQENAAYIFHGAASGITANPATIIKFDQKSLNILQVSATSAGDVNGDGYSDIVIGMPYYSNSEIAEGNIRIYPGSSVGIDQTNVLLNLESGREFSYFGFSVSNGGDVNDDGFSDVVIGSPGYNTIDPFIDDSEPNEGAAFIYFGGRDAGFRNNLRLYNTNLTTPINQTQFTQNNFGAGLYSKSFLGGNKGKLVWETKAAGQGFSKGANNVITNSTQSSGSQNVYASLGLLGTELKNVISKQGNATKVRVRVKYDPALALTGQTYGPWRYLSSYLGGGGVSPVPDEAGNAMTETVRRKALANESVLVYPNPASDKIWIEVQDGNTFTQVRILTSNGKLVLQSTEREVDVSKLVPGKYIVLVGHSDGSQSSQSLLISK